MTASAASPAVGKSVALVVGAGFAGAVAARVLADHGWFVRVIDKRSHVGGNAYDCVDEWGVRIHPYGPHLFHTNSRSVMQFLSRFTEWSFYEHRVVASVDGLLVPMPINRTTINMLYGLNLTSQGAAAFLDRVRVERQPARTSEDVVLSGVGHDLCEKLYRGYTSKQWGRDLSELLAGVAARIPVRTNDDDRYFEDAYQFMPARGYAEMFRSLLDHEHIDVKLSTGYHRDAVAEVDHVVYTGPIDEYFGFRFGRLQYRSLEFEHIHVEGDRLQQPVATINYPNEHEFTRSTEFRHITSQVHSGTSLVREYPRPVGDPYYPIPDVRNGQLYKKYKELADNTPCVTFVGRLAQYKYYNMDQVVAAALTASRRLVEGSGRRP